MLGAFVAAIGGVILGITLTLLFVSIVRMGDGK